MVEDNISNIKYNFKNSSGSDISYLIQAINILGEDLVGCELGVHRGYSSMTMLHNCSLKKLYLIDSWEPYFDYLKVNPDGQPSYHINNLDSEINKFLAYHHVNNSGHKHLVEIINKDSLKAVDEIENNSLDFIFFDAMMNTDQTYKEALAYYPKLKKGSVFFGHDASSFIQVIQPIKKVKEKFNNKNKIFTYNNTFLFKI